MVSECLNLGNFTLTPSCLPFVNKLIGSSSFEMVNLSRNLIDPTSIRLLTTIQQLSLNNCKLGNDVLETLFVQLMDSAIVKISLSSP